MKAAVTVRLDELPDAVAEVRRQLEAEGEPLVSWSWKADPLERDSSWITVTGTT